MFRCWLLSLLVAVVLFGSVSGDHCHIDPVAVAGDGQQSCEALGYAGGIKVESNEPATGTKSLVYDNGVTTVTYTIKYVFTEPDGEGQYYKFAFCADFEVASVVMKAGDIQQYIYNETEGLGIECYQCDHYDDELVPPLKNDNQQSISNAQVCFNDGGLVNLPPVAPPTIGGDPIYRTFDGLKFEYTGVCPILLTQDCHNSQFKVLSLNTECGLKSCLEELHVSFADGVGGETSLVFGLGPIVELNHVHVLDLLSLLENDYVVAGGRLSARVLPKPIAGAHHLVTLKTDVGLTVHWTGSIWGVSKIALSDDANQHACGILGKKNGVVHDDFRFRNGTVMDLSGLIVEGELKHEESVLKWASEWIEKPESAPASWSMSSCQHKANGQIVQDNCGAQEQENVGRICRRLFSVVREDCLQSGVKVDQLIASCVQHACSCLRMKENRLNCVQWAFREVDRDCLTAPRMPAEEENGMVF